MRTGQLDRGDHGASDRSNAVCSRCWWKRAELPNVLAAMDCFAVSRLSVLGLKTEQPSLPESRGTDLQTSEAHQSLVVFHCFDDDFSGSICTKEIFDNDGFLLQFLIVFEEGL